MRSPYSTFIIIALIMIAGVCAILYFSTTWSTYVIWLIACSITTFILFRYDKFRSSRGGLRVPEGVLLGLTLIGGFPGAWLGMLWPPRHKTQHLTFWAVFFISLMLHLAFAFAF